jgi:multiple antibiotic resistance protein
MADLALFEKIGTAATLLLVLLNPFLLSIYLVELMDRLDAKTFRNVLVRGTLVSGAVFAIFALTGDAFFRSVLQVRFASFLIFGGVLFLFISVRFVLDGRGALFAFRGEPEHVAGAIAMPFMIGPGTVSASIFAGARLPLPAAFFSIALGLFVSVVIVLTFRSIHLKLSSSRARLANRYVDLIGRISALVLGTVAVDMILNGLGMWIGTLSTR